MNPSGPSQRQFTFWAEICSDRATLIEEDRDEAQDGEIEALRKIAAFLRTHVLTAEVTP